MRGVLYFLFYLTIFGVFITGTSWFIYESNETPVIVHLFYLGVIIAELILIRIFQAEINHESVVNIEEMIREDRTEKFVGRYKGEEKEKHSD